MMRPVDIVIPIHDAREATLRCIASVLEHTPSDARIVLADDASRDPELCRALEAIAAREPRVELRRSARNLGFVATCNAAMAAARGHDVLLLNSDTVVTRGFLGRLRACAYDTPDTGIVCPLSNNATILSVPRFCEDNPLPAGHTADSFAELVARVSPRLRPDIATAVGFCMYLRAELLERVGLFDARFGRGYGEENDLAERALAAGFRIRAADDAFVFHEGSASFGSAAAPQKEQNTAVLLRLYPDYFEKISAFVAANPLRPVQEAIARALGEEGG